MIHLINQKGKNILFLTNILEFYKINQRTSSIILDIKSGLTRNQILERYALLDNEYDRIIELLKRDLKSATVAKETHHLKKLILNVSNSCNLNCKYCYANGGVYNSAEKLMNFNTAKTAIDKFISYFGEIQQIQFFGGEPLLNYELISQCCEYIIQEQKNGRIHYIPIFGIVTNGTVINEKSKRPIRRCLPSAFRLYYNHCKSNSIRVFQVG